MARLENGHSFDFDTEVCQKCGMSKKEYEDNKDRPACTGRQKTQEERGPTPGFRKD